MNRGGCRLRNSVFTAEREESTNPELEAEPKRDMIAHGISAEEIERVLKAKMKGG